MVFLLRLPVQAVHFFTKGYLNQYHQQAVLVHLDVFAVAYLLVIRKTAGWHKLSDCISVSQFMKFCGIAKDETAQKAISELAAAGLVRLEKQAGKITRFFLNMLPENFDEVPPKNGGTTTPENGVHPENGGTPENGDWVPPKNGGTTTPENGVHPENGGTPENGDWVPQKNGGTTTPKNGGSTKYNTKNTITKNNKYIAQDEKPKRTKANSHEADLQTLQNLGVDEQIALDWLQTRKDKRAGSLTQTVIAALQREAAKAGLTVPQAVQVAAERNWARFVASYLQNEQAGFGGGMNTPNGVRPNRITQIPRHGAEAKSGLARDIFK